MITHLLSGGTYNALMLILALVALVAAALGVIYGRRALFPPKRQLAITALPPVSLLATDLAEDAGIIVSHKDDRLISPHVVTLSIENVGKYAVDSDEYDKERPLSIDLGVPVKVILKTSMRPNRSYSVTTPQC